MHKILQALRGHERLLPVVIGAGILLALLIAISIIAYDRNENAQFQSATDNWSLIVPAITAKDHVLGNAFAPIQLIVYSDLTCQYCKELFQTIIPKLQATYGNTITVTYRYFPLLNNPRAETEAETAECISQTAGNSAFWKFVTAIYEQPDYESGLSTYVMDTLARDVGADKGMVDACVAKRSTVPIVQSEVLQASIAGLSIRPSIVVKSSSRAIVVAGSYASQLTAAITYILDTNTQ